MASGVQTLESSKNPPSSDQTKKKKKAKKTMKEKKPAAEAPVSAAAAAAASREKRKSGHVIDEIFEGVKKKKKKAAKDEAEEMAKRKITEGRGGSTSAEKADTKTNKKEKKKSGGAFVAPAVDEDLAQKRRRRRTADGLAIYSPEELGVGNPDAGDMILGASSDSSVGRRHGSGRGSTFSSTPPPPAEDLGASVLLSPAAGPDVSTPLPPAAGLGASAPLPPARGPGVSAPPPPTSCLGLKTSLPPATSSGLEMPPLPAIGPSLETPPPLATDDVASRYKGVGSHVEDTRPEVWINMGKVEPAQASQFITMTLQSHFPGSVHRFNNFPMDVQDMLYDMFMKSHRFTRPSDMEQSRSAWTTTARENFKHLLYNARKIAEKNSGSTNRTCWKEHGPAWIRREHWEGLCDKWAEEKWIENSAKAKVNRSAHSEANVHTSGSVSFATHKTRMVFDETHKKKGTGQYVSERALEVEESYSKHMNEKYGTECTQQPELDPDVWIAVAGVPKTGHVYGFGQNLDASRVISTASSRSSHATIAFTKPPSSSSLDDIRDLIRDKMSGLLTELSQEIHSMISEFVQALLSQAISRAGIPPPHGAPSIAAQPPHVPSPRDVKEEDEDIDMKNAADL